MRFRLGALQAYLTRRKPLHIRLVSHARKAVQGERARYGTRIGIVLRVGDRLPTEADLSRLRVAGAFEVFEAGEAISDRSGSEVR